MPDPQAVRSMFARIAGRYDLLNRLLSGGIDQRWRRFTVRRTGELLGGLAGRRIVDVCCGTGDLSVLYRAGGARVLGVDFTGEMLARAVPKAGPEGLSYARGDALGLPLRAGAVEAGAIAFGLRNLADRRAGLRELARVVRPGGVVAVLEFSSPRRGPFAALHRIYMTRVLPRIGALISGDGGAYRYLPDTVLAWPEPATLAEEMRSCGFEDVRFERLTGGIVALHTGRVARREERA